MKTFALLAFGMLVMAQSPSLAPSVEAPHSAPSMALHIEHAEVRHGETLGS